MLAAAGWQGRAEDGPLFDPCCGAGTIAIEAAQLACGIAPGLQRSFAFERQLPFAALRERPGSSCGGEARARARARGAGLRRRRELSHDRLRARATPSAPASRRHRVQDRRRAAAAAPAPRRPAR
jgi:hypothetical protein